MINFIDEKGVKHSAIVECKKTKGVNGEKSLSGTIYTNDEILEGIGRGWRLEFENEKYCLTYVYPIDEGNRIVVEFDAVHEFFFDLNKKVVYTELNGSNTAKAYLDLIFNGSGYSYLLEVNIPAFEKERFGMRNRLDLFKEFVSDTGVEFSVNGKVVRILEKVGSNLSTIVKKGFNLNELRIEKDPGSFITYKKGFGAWVDDDDHSKGRLEVEYLSPLASIYGKLEGDPIVDERYKVASNFETRLKNDVESSYDISVDIDMEDLTRAGYEYEQPHEGDYIMAINKDLGFEQKIRIMSYETSYDTNGNIIDHKVSCGSDNIIRKSIKEDDEFRKEIQAGLEGAISTSNKAWVSANGKNAVFEGPNEPTATAIGDTWFQIDGDKKIMRIWNGYEWNPFFNPGVIEEAIKDLDGELGLTTTTANDAVNKAEQAIRDIGFANSAIIAADGKISSLEQNLDGFQQVVQNTYADKTTVTALATQWTQTTELANGHTSQISSLGNDLNFRVKSDEIITQINLSPENILISGKRITIDGNTYIANGVIKTAHIADLSVSGAKIANATIGSAKIINLDASKITAGTLNAGLVTVSTSNGNKQIAIDSNGLSALDSNGKLRLSIGVRDLGGVGQSDPSNIVFYSGNGNNSMYLGTNTADTFVIAPAGGNMQSLFSMPVGLTISSRQLRLTDPRGTSDYIEIRRTVDGTDEMIVFPSKPFSGQIGSAAENRWFRVMRASQIVGHTLNVGYGAGAPHLGDLSVGVDSGAPEVGSTQAFVRSKAVYNRIYGSQPTVCVTDYGTLGRIVSARKYKEHISKAATVIRNAKDILKIVPSEWYIKGRLDKREYGFIADDFHELGLTEVVQYGSDGQVEGLAYDRISMYHNVILQDHEKEISALKTTMNFDIWQLKNEIKELKNEINSLRQAVA